MRSKVWDMALEYVHWLLSTETDSRPQHCFFELGDFDVGMSILLGSRGLFLVFFLLG